MSEKKLRIAVLWTELSAYMNSCMLALKNRYDVDLLVYRVSRSSSGHPYADDIFSWIPDLQTLPDGSNDHMEDVLEKLASFAPDVVLVAGWAVPVYREVLKRLKKQGLYVIGGMDNPWRGTTRQWMGVLFSKWYLQGWIDAIWVPGERAASFARRLGYKGDRLLYGVYSADITQFQQVALWRQADDGSMSRRFVFVGRFDEIKGFPDLLDAYEIYHSQVENPWELLLVGTGPLEPLVQNRPGVRSLGFVQPDKLPDVLKEASIFVLPSRHDPWPLVIHEAVSSGLPILCSRQCGSSVELVQDGLNGYLFDAGDVNRLANLMSYMSSGVVDLAELGRRSAELSRRYSPLQWADYLMRYLESTVQK